MAQIRHVYSPRADPIDTAPRRQVTLPGWGQLAWLAGALAVWTWLLLGFPLDPDYTAGELLDHLQAWRETGVLYPPLAELPPLRVLNYPPLVLGMARGLADLGLSALTAGRMANGLGLLALLAGVAWWARARGARGAALAGTVGLLGASYPLLYAAGQFHIELWAAAGTLWGFALLDRGASFAGAALGGLALALACFAKQTQAVAALVALIWVWSFRRRAAPAATASFLAAGLAGAAAISAVWGREAWRHLLGYTVGTFSAGNLALQMASHVAPWLILLAFALRAAREDPARARADAAFWYLAGALLWSFSAVRTGSSYAYFLDLHLATAIWVGPRVFGAPGVPSRTWRALLAAQILAADVGAGAALAVDVDRLARTRAELTGLCATLVPEPRVMAEEAGLMRACGRPALLHPFILTSLAQQGLWDSAALERAIRAGDFPIVVLPFDPRTAVSGAHAERWTPGLLAAFRQAPVIEPGPTGRWLARW